MPLKPKSDGRSKRKAGAGTARPVIDRALAVLEASGADTVDRLASLNHDPLAELVNMAQGRGDCCYSLVEEAVAIIRMISDKAKSRFPRSADELLASADAIQAKLAGIPTVTERNRINLALVEFQIARLKAIEPPKPVTDEVNSIEVIWT